LYFSIATLVIIVENALILAIQNAYFSILTTNFSKQTSTTDYLLHSQLSLNIIFQCFKNKDKSKYIESTQPDSYFSNKRNNILFL
jgi:hypothetical protein